MRSQVVYAARTLPAAYERPCYFASGSELSASKVNHTSEQRRQHRHDFLATLNNIATKRWRPWDPFLLLCAQPGILKIESSVPEHVERRLLQRVTACHMVRG